MAWRRGDSCEEQSTSLILDIKLCGISHPSTGTRLNGPTSNNFVVYLMRGKGMVRRAASVAPDSVGATRNGDIALELMCG